MERVIPPAVVFDCDGTLVDSELIHAKALHGALAVIGVALSPEQIRSQSVGFANADFLRRIAEECGLTLSVNMEMIVEEIALRLIADELSPMKGANQLLNGLAENAVRLAVASNSSRRLVQRMLSVAGLSRAFGERIAVREDVAAPKPAPDLYRFAAELLSTDVEDCLAVEDSPVGVAAAQRAGIAVVGFCPPSGAFRESDLMRAGAFAVFSDLGELLHWPLRSGGSGPG
jgi:HAD superfamily hydrolase (TIGR01509 family)